MQVTIHDIQFVDVLGLGAFGRVVLVRYKGQTLALKVMNKDVIEEKNLKPLVLRERKVMETVDCHYVVRQLTFVSNRICYSTKV